tara:strand:- start:766 stop:1083 length:318 start_codon:yes stop_codon:yes gene_type:complete
MKKSKYEMFIFYKDKRLCKFKIDTDDINEIYNSMGKKLIMDGLKNNISIDKQIETYKKGVETIHQRKEDCYKVRASDYLMVLSCIMSLIKFRQFDLDNVIILKNK